MINQSQILRAAFALRFNNAIQGYREKLTDYSQITVMILDSATPGRMSIRYYRELSGSRLMDAVEDWHRNFAWEQCYRKEQKEKKGKSVSESIVFFGAPAPKDIAVSYIWGECRFQAETAYY